MTHNTQDWEERFKSTLENPKESLANYIRDSRMMLSWLVGLGGQALEVGCGSGRACIAYGGLSKERVVGVDIEPGVVKLAQEVGKKLSSGLNVEFMYGDGFFLPFANKTFNTAFSSGVLEHYSDEDIIKLLREQARVARYIIIQVPTLHFREIHRVGYGDERWLNKFQWIELIGKVDIGPVLEMCFLGNEGEEEAFFAVLDTGE